MAPTPRPRTAPVGLEVIVDALAAAGRPCLVASKSSAIADVSVTGACLDSRAVHPGDLYAALPGRHVHGAQFIAQAVESGAVAVLTDAVGAEVIAAHGYGLPVLVVDDPRAALGLASALAFGRPGDRLTVLGVTGTNGKTTVAAMVAAGLRAAGKRVGVIGTVGTRIDDEELPGVRTTPEAPDLQALLALMVERSVEAVVMEVSSIAVDEHRVDGLVLDAIGFTNLTQDHLDYHGTMATYFDAKAHLFTPAHAHFGVVGIDDEWGRDLVRRSDVPIRTWSLTDPSADWHAVRDARGLAVMGPDGQWLSLVVPLPGAFNVANALCAIGLLAAVGIAASDAIAGIAATSVPGRMQIVEAAGVVGIVDYAHTPDAVDRVLRAARAEYDGRLIAVLGAGGDRDRSKRPLMGECAARIADHVIVTDDNPRSEVPAGIRAEVLAGVESVAPARRASVEEVGDRREAITVAVRQARPGDIVLVLGKGHEQGQEVMGVIEPFDDVAVLREALVGLSGGPA